MTNRSENFERDLDREILRSEIFSALWSAFSDKKSDGLTLTSLAEMLGKDKAYISRVLSTQPNCKIDTISDVANALGLRPEMEFVDRATGVRYTSGGPSRHKSSSNLFYKKYDFVDYEPSVAMGIR